MRGSLRLFAAVLAVGAASVVHAWNCPGHMLVTQVAMNMLASQSPETLRKLQPALSAQMATNDSMSINAEVGCWADNIRDETAAYATWHYYDLCYKTDDSASCPATNPGALREVITLGRSTLIEALRELRKEPNKPRTLSTAAFWLSFLIHVIGDAHQPLHMCTFYSEQFPDGDKAGNRLFVQVDGREIKLHSLCDAAGGALFRKPPHPLLDFPNELDAFENQASELQSTYTFSPAVSQDLSLSTWESEDLAFCAEKIYLHGTLLNETILDDDYLSTLREGLLGRVTLGGVRLAHFLIDLVASV
jgi:hypothetical protein